MSKLYYISGERNENSVKICLKSRFLWNGNLEKLKITVKLKINAFFAKYESYNHSTTSMKTFKYDLELKIILFYVFENLIFSPYFCFLVKNLKNLTETEFLFLTQTMCFGPNGNTNKQLKFELEPWEDNIGWDIGGVVSIYKVFGCQKSGYFKFFGTYLPPASHNHISLFFHVCVKFSLTNFAIL